MKCLIVEDEFITRQLMQVYLAELGEVFIAVNGQEAVDAFIISCDNKEPYDLICMDIMMPEMDGIEALTKIRDHEKECGIRGLDVAKVIMTTAKRQSKDIYGAFNTGCESYLVKPFTKQELFSEIEKLGLTVTQKH